MNKRIAVAIVVLALGCWALAQHGPERITNGPVVEAVSNNSATIAWSTNSGGTSIVHYGTDRNNLNQTAQEPYQQGGSTHRVIIPNLQPNTTYYFAVVSGEGQGTGTSAQSGVDHFTTLNMNDTEVPLYRLDKPGQGHFYTTDFNEQQRATQSGYKLEGIAGYVLKSPSAGTEPLFRLRAQNGEHFYTTNAQERDNVIRQLHFTDEGIAGYVAVSPVQGTVPLYRLVDQNGSHLYTTSADEVNRVKAAGWREEGVIGYIWPS